MIKKQKKEASLVLKDVEQAIFDALDDGVFYIADEKKHKKIDEKKHHILDMVDQRMNRLRNNKSAYSRKRERIRNESCHYMSAKTNSPKANESRLNLNNISGIHSVNDLKYSSFEHNKF